MKKCFNNVQIFNSSEDCNKFSKSVSYETLVVGTATTGSECGEALEIEGVITRRTSVRRSYLPEQGTHANKESLFTSVTWLMRLPRRIQRMLLVMTIPVLALIFTIATTAESRAECTAVKKGWRQECETLKESGGTCGEGCSYTYNPDTKTVYITATGNDAIIKSSAFHGHYYENNKMPAKTFVINGAIKIGSNAFTASSEVISGANSALILTGIGHHAFGDGATLSGTIIIPEGATFGSIAFEGVTLADNAKIYCGVKNCAQKMIDACEYGEPNTTWCLQKVNKILSDRKLLPYPENCLKMGATGCVNCKSDSFRLNDGYCDRLRYTPAEAAEVLHNDNTNSVTITFKK